MMKTRSLSFCVATVALLASACGASDTPTGTPNPSPSAPSSEMHDMSADEMAAMEGPSEAATMICSDEIRTVIRRTLALNRQPTPRRSWSANDLTLVCSYRLPDGILKLSVHDAPNDETGRPFFQRLRTELPGATTIRGVQALGFPALETSNGTVAFLKDGKTLQVDATGVSASTLPSGLTRQEAAYGIASAVIACWKE